MYYACFDHYPRRSQLTWPESKMKVVYEVLESAENAVVVATDVEDINAAVQAAAEPIREVADEYRQASDAMGAAGKTSVSAAEMLDAAADELETWEAPVEENGDITRIEIEEWSAMLRERGLDPGDYKIENALSRHRAFVAQDLDEGELERRVNTRISEEGIDPVMEAKDEALGELRNLGIDT
jgi:hypothetical protein